MIASPSAENADAPSLDSSGQEARLQQARLQKARLKVKAFRSRLSAQPAQPKPEDSLQSQPQSVLIKKWGKEFRVSADPMERDKQLLRYQSTADFAEMVDRNTGSPASIRLRVGSTQSAQDKLTEIRKYYPDAIPYGDDNFVYTDPATEMPRLHNPPGIDWGDVPGVTRETAVFVGSILGTIVGAAFGSSVPVVGTIGGGATGAAAGASGTASVFDALAEKFGYTTDTRTTGEKMLDYSIEAGFAFAGEKLAGPLGAAVKKGAKRLFGGGTRKAMEIHSALIAQGVRPSVATVTQGRGAQTIESALDSSFAAANTLHKNIEKNIAAIEAAAAKQANKVGKAITSQGTGEIIIDAVTEAEKRFRDRQTELENSLANYVALRFGSTQAAFVPVNSVKALKAELMTEIDQAPASLGKLYKAPLQILESIEADAAAAGGISYSAFRKLRTSIGELLRGPAEDAIARTMNKRIYAAMSEDLGIFASTIGRRGTEDVIARKFEETIAFTREWKEANKELFKKLLRTDAPEKAFRYAMNSSKDGGTQLARLKKEFTEDEWNSISASILHKMGTSGFKDGESFNVAQYLKNYNQVLSEEAKEALFNQELRQSLDELTKAMEYLQANKQVANFSNTARATNVLEVMRAFGSKMVGPGVAFAAGGPVGLFLGSVVMPMTAAKLMTSPRFVKWLATPVTGPSKVAAHMGKLAGIAQDDPEIREEIYELLNVLQTPQPIQSQGNQ
jgi:hypothetical protein